MAIEIDRSQISMRGISGHSSRSPNSDLSNAPVARNAPASRPEKSCWGTKSNFLPAHATALTLYFLAGTFAHAEPLPYEFWKSREAAFNEVVFSRTPGTHLPLAPSLEPNSFKLPSYAGGAPSGEGICVLGFLLSADLSDDARVKPLIGSALRWSSPEGIPSNGIGGKAATSYWYELLPAVLLTQLAMRHPESAEMDANLARMADRYAVIIRELGGPRADFNQTSFITHRSQKGPVINGRWTEPDSGAAMAYVCYAAWLRHQQPAHLEAARWAMDALERRTIADGNPLYEFCLYCAPVLAARMNREHGTHYDVRKLLDWCLGKNDGPKSARPWWGRIDRDFNGVAATGLCGSTRDGDAYAFAMNSFVAASMIAPLAAEDPDFAPEIGRWLCQLTRSARNFFPDEVSAAQQSGPEHRGTRLAAIPYEGLREKKRLITDVHETSEGHWLAELPNGTGDFRWRAEVKSSDGQSMRVRVLNNENKQIYTGNYRLNSGQTSLGGLLRSTQTPLRIEFTIEDAPVSLTKLRVENHPGSGPWLTGDPVFFDWGAKTDLAVYGGAHLGSFTALLIASKHPALQVFDLAATDHLGHGDRPRLLFVNTGESEIVQDGFKVPAHGTLLR